MGLHGRRHLRSVAALLLALGAVLGPAAGAAPTVDAAAAYSVNLYRQG